MCFPRNTPKHAQQASVAIESSSSATEDDVLEVPDDSGFLALVVPGLYQSFVAAHWEFGQLVEHFRQQMARRSLLIWSTGLEGTWRVDVRVGGADVLGFRAVTGPLRVEGGSVLLTSYDSLTMAAQFADVSLPEPHDVARLIALPDGHYRCRIVQQFDPETEETAPGEADFVISITEVTEGPPAWSEIPWFCADPNAAVDWPRD
jgi:hypothetical protein